MNFLNQIRQPKLSDIELIVIDLTKASVHDIHYLKDIKSMYTGCVILGDKV
ncbi:hypothetical protein M2451_004070 [Dysgonomonas sp. PFB1-18]|nr:hypothetical protein [Dysgonomonas sp. PF1-14]MDH6341040.1 hypothetical protein [Dysgonomonas sp. PF1-16]MDH6382723.1 hypothetical protein [Dysgonomonas sp. PFB1-18]MDH6400014.1 hypothetical protein [Dysgonomonas sp. PF1-23]